MRAALVDNIIYAIGGREGDYSDGNYDPTASIFSWNPSTDSWQSVGNLATARSRQAVIAIPYSFIQSECSDMFST